MDVSIVIPVYNSSSFIRNSVEQLIKVLDTMAVTYEILLRDDGSSDDSREVLREFSAHSPRIRTFFNEENRGLGFTLRHLFADAQGEKVIYMDCDLPFGADVVKEVLAGLEQHDIVVCSRYMGKRNNVPWPRKAASRAYYYLCRILFNIPVKDIGSGTVGFRRKAISGLNLISDGFGIHAEMFVKAFHRHSSVVETGADTAREERGNSYIFRHGLSILRETLRLKRNLRY